MNCDVMRDNMCVGQYVALFSIDHESRPDRAPLQLRLPRLRIIGRRSLHKNCKQWIMMSLVAFIQKRLTTHFASEHALQLAQVHQSAL